MAGMWCENCHNYPSDSEDETCSNCGEYYTYQEDEREDDDQSDYYREVENDQYYYKDDADDEEEEEKEEEDDDDDDDEEEEEKEDDDDNDEDDDNDDNDEDDDDDDDDDDDTSSSSNDDDDDDDESDTSSSNDDDEEEYHFREKRCYGSFRCPSCSKRWESAYVFCRKRRGSLKPLYEQDCKECGAGCLPYRVAPLRCSRCWETDCTCERRHSDFNKPHRSDLCHRCRSGRRCTQS